MQLPRLYSCPYIFRFDVRILVLSVCCCGMTGFVMAIVNSSLGMHCMYEMALGRIRSPNERHRIEGSVCIKVWEVPTTS